MKNHLICVLALFLSIVSGMTQEIPETKTDRVPSSTKIEGSCREVLDKTEWVAIATSGPDGPHVVGTWGDYMRRLGIGDKLMAPVGGMRKTEANLRQDPRVEILIATRQVRGTNGPGKGCAILGHAEIETTGPNFTAVKAQFPWARAALVVHVEQSKPLL